MGMFSSLIVFMCRSFIGLELDVEKVEHLKPSEVACPSREQLRNLAFRPERFTVGVSGKA